MAIKFHKPMECLSVKKLPSGEQWTYEIKLDGFRVEAVRTADRVTLYSKQGKLLTAQFIQIALELEKLPPGTAIDGELVALDKSGVPRFNLLQNYRSGSAHLMYFAFDFLAHKGLDVSKLPLSERRELLRTIVQRGPHVDLAAGRTTWKRWNVSPGNTNSKVSSRRDWTATMNQGSGQAPGSSCVSTVARSS